MQRHEQIIKNMIKKLEESKKTTSKIEAETSSEKDTVLEWNRMPGERPGSPPPSPITIYWITEYT